MEKIRAEKLKDYAEQALSTESVFRSPDLAFSKNGLAVFPGFCDVHVHLREPGFFYKESIKSGTRAAARGGFTAVCAMPNLNPVPDSPENLLPEQSIIERDAVINVYPYGAITRGERGEELSDMAGLAPSVIAFTDDGRGVQSADIMRRAMLKAKSLGKIIAAHCEDNTLLSGGYIHKGEYAKRYGHAGISSESEYKQIERDIALLRETGAAYHVCHVSAKESVEIIRRAKIEGLNVTCETAPHYLVFSDDMLLDDGRFKMNPPIRGRADREALIAGIADGTIDMIATDHAPHSAEEKSRGLKGSLMGVTGLETAFPALYTHLVKPGIISLEKLVELMCLNPRKRFGIPLSEDYSVWDLSAEKEVNPAEFLSKGKSTPFAGMRLFGENLITVCGGKTVYLNKDRVSE